MGVDLNKLIMISTNNSFKNNGVNRGTLVIPASVAAGAIYTNTATFNIPTGVDFQAAFGFFTSYSARIFAGPAFTTYQDRWYDVSQVQDVFFVTSAGVVSGQLITNINGNTITVTLRISRQGSSAITITHGTYAIPISIIAYSMAS
jgi:hypothetical protein